MKLKSSTIFNKDSENIELGKLGSNNVNNTLPRRRWFRIGLEEVLEDLPLSPLSLNQFARFLNNVEHTPENLIFFIWLKNYRDYYELNNSSKSISKSKFKRGSIQLTEAKRRSLIHTHSQYPRSPSILIPPGNVCPRWSRDSEISNTSSQLEANRSSIGWTPTHQHHLSTSMMPIIPNHLPHSEIIDQAIRTFFSPDSNLELNLTGDCKDRTLHQLTFSTHPSVFDPIAHHIFYLMSANSFPSFVNYQSQSNTYYLKLFRIFISLILLGGTCLLSYHAVMSQWSSYLSIILFLLYWTTISTCLESILTLRLIGGLNCYYLLLQRLIYNESIELPPNLQIPISYQLKFRLFFISRWNWIKGWFGLRERGPFREPNFLRVCLGYWLTLLGSLAASLYMYYDLRH